MRYYDLTFGDQHITSHPNGGFDPEAQRIEFQIHYKQNRVAADSGSVRVYGVPLALMRKKWQQQPLILNAGMKGGMPLSQAQSGQSGEIANAIIEHSMGMWQGTDMYLEHVLTMGQPNTGDDGSGAGTEDNPNGGYPSTGPGQGGQGGPRPGPQSVPVGGTPARLAARRTRLYGAQARGLGPSVEPAASPAGIISSAIGIASAANTLSGGSLASGALGLLQQAVNTIAGTFGGGGYNQKPQNLIHNWQPNTPLSQAIQQTLSIAFPGLPVTIQISPSLKLSYQDAAVFTGLAQYAAYLKTISHSIMGAFSAAGYAGIDIFTHGKGLLVTDGTVKATAKGKVNFWDLIGQPTWIDQTNVQFKTVLRGDILCGDDVTLPIALLSPSPAPGPVGSEAPATGDTLPGSLRIMQISHYGDSRSPQPDAWASVFIGSTGASSGGDSSGAGTEDNPNGGYPSTGPGQGGQGGPRPGPQSVPWPESTALRLSQRVSRRYG